MLFIILIAILALVIIITKRRVGMPILVALVAWFVINLWKIDLARLIIETGISQSVALVSAILEIVAVLLPVAWMIYYSRRSNSGLIRLIAESVLFGVLVIYLLRGPIGQVLALDANSVKLAGLASQFEKLILTISGVFALSEVLRYRAE